MKILEEEIIKIDKLKNNHIYLIKYQGISLALFKEGDFFVNHKNNLKKINFKEAQPFYEYSNPVNNFLDIVPEVLKIEQIKRDIINNRVKYSAGFLSQIEKEKIIKNFIKEKPEDYEIVCDHMTICLGSIYDKSLLGKEEKAIITHIGKSEELGIIALKVETNIPSKNEIKHITLFKREEVDAAKSNLITEWYPVNKIDIILNVGERLNNKELRLYNQDNKHIKQTTKIKLS